MPVQSDTPEPTWIYIYTKNFGSIFGSGTSGSCSGSKAMNLCIIGSDVLRKKKKEIS